MNSHRIVAGYTKRISLHCRPSQGRPLVAQRIGCVLLAGLASLAVPLASSAREFSVSPDQARRALDSYVHRADDSYGWKVRRTGNLGKTGFAELILTSQTWQGMPWKHQLFLLRPSRIREDNRHAMLVIAGGSWKDELEHAAGENEPLPRDAQRIAILAEALRTPVAVLLQVPRQPLFDGKHEDAIISYTFDRFLNTSDTNWPLLLPMVKSAVRAMDASQEFWKQRWSLNVDTFTITGASKRGWTTWLTGAVDKRATALAPMVIDVLNMKPHLKLQKRVWGKYSEQINDYTERGLPELMDSKPGEILRQIIDPYSYRERFRQPKLILIGTNDRYWPVDALNLYWSDLPGPKYVLYVPNTGHGLNDLARVTGSINALHQHAAANFPLPKLRWKYESTPTGIRLTMSSDKPMRSAAVWLASSPTRDFRNATWHARELRRTDGQGSYRFEYERPAKGYAAMFGEATYGDLPLAYYFSTTLQVIGAEAEPATTAADSE